MRNASVDRVNRRLNRISRRSGQPLRRAAAVACEQLETRRMFATFNYSGTSGPDVITIYIEQWSNTRTLDISINGAHQFANTPFITDVNIYGKGGNDQISVVRGSVGTHVNVYGEAGDDTLTFGDWALNGSYDAFGGTGNDTVVVDRNPDFPDLEDYGNEYRINDDGFGFGSIVNNDWVNFDAAVENFHFYGTGGDDEIFIDSTKAGRPYWIYGGKGQDTITVGNGDIDSQILGELHVFGDEGSDRVKFNDSADGGNDNYQLFANIFSKPGALATSVVYSSEMAEVIANDGVNAIEVISSISPSVTLRGGGGADTFNIGTGNLDGIGQLNLYIDGDDQKDWQNPDAAVDTVNVKDQNKGGSINYAYSDTGVTRTGTPKIKFQNTVDRLRLFTGGGNNTIFNDNTATKPLYLESNGGMDNITCGSGNDTILAGPGHDFVFAGGGNDSIDGGAGIDNMMGGSGNDTVTYESRTAAITIDRNTVGGEGEAGENDTINDDVETLRTGSGADKIITKPTLALTAFTGFGNDTLTGSNVGDYLDAGQGVDSVTGNDGNDFIFLRGSLGSRAYGGADNDQIFIYSPAGMWIEGGSGNDFLNGGGGDDTIAGGEGNDQAYGGGGNDTIFGEAGDDLLEGNAGNDFIDGGDDKDRIYGHDGADWLYGGEGDDSLTGNAGADWLFGDAGNDALDAWDGAGGDWVDGGDGALDMFSLDATDKLITA